MSVNKLLVRIGLAAGLLLSIASVLNMCSAEACVEAHKYALLGIPMSFLGVGFFIAAGVIYELGGLNKLLPPLFSLMIYCASGAEVAFVLIQKYKIRQWCPLCLGVAAAVYFVALVVSVRGIKEISAEVKERRTLLMQLTRRIAVILCVFAVGFFAAYNGVKKSEAEETVPNIFLGNQGSSVEVFIVTDWFCPACMKAEQEIEKAIPLIEKKARIVFVDKPIHPETLNYTPYNLSFLSYEKGKYMELRKALQDLAKKTKEPTPEDVNGAISPLHVVYKPLSFLSSTRGMKYYDSVTREFRVDATPTVVIRDAKTGKVARLIGGKDITAVNITRAVEEVSR